MVVSIFDGFHFPIAIALEVYNNYYFSPFIIEQELYQDC